jgi:hypothetical protein
MVFQRVIILGLCSLHFYAALSYPLDSKLDFEIMEQRLHHEKIIDIAPFSNSGGVKPFHTIDIVTLESGLKALFKTGRYPYAEVAGYRLSKLLNLYLVPPTIFRTINDTHGSLQLYIPAKDLASIPNPKHMLKKIGEKTICAAKFFYYLAGQWDTHYGNQLIEKTDSGYRLWLIDNSSMLHRTHSIYGGLTFVAKGIRLNGPPPLSKNFPFEVATTIEGQQICKVFAPFITSKEYLTSLAKRPQKYIIWDSTLWVAYNTNRPGTFGCYTATYDNLLLDASKNLTRQDLTNVWAEWMAVEPYFAQQLTELSLIRRDELLEASYSGNMIGIKGE